MVRCGAGDCCVILRFCDCLYVACGLVNSVVLSTSLFGCWFLCVTLWVVLLCLFVFCDFVGSWIALRFGVCYGDLVLWWVLGVICDWWLHDFLVIVVIALGLICDDW